MVIFATVIGLILMVIGVPIFAVFIIFGGFITGVHLEVPWSSLSQQMLESVSKYILLAIPLYILAANIMFQGGLSERLVNMFVRFVQHMRGGLPIALVLSIALFSAISGSILASIVAIGGIMIPIMVKHGYSKAYSAALCAAVAGIDTLIPPSNVAIIYAAITGVSVGKVFMAGLLPGIFQASVLLIVAVIMSGKVERMPAASWEERWQACYRALPILAMPILILGGIYSGVFSPVEAAAVACVYAVFVGFFVYKDLTISNLWRALIATVETTVVIFTLIAGATLLSAAITYTRIPQQITESIIFYGINPMLFLVAAAVVLLILGMFMEAIPCIYITVPIIFPIALILKVDLIHLYVVVCCYLGVGLMTPPVCVGAYTAAAVAKESPEKVVHQLPAYCGATICCGVVYIFVPWLSTWIPSMMKF
jgi:C4-dicarboxylate transporter, DctM subunit